MTRYTLTADTEWIAALKRAAHAAEVSASEYVRRAVANQIESDTMAASRSSIGKAPKGAK